MAKQKGDFKIEGTLDGICFYRMGADYYAREKSCLSGKRFWRDKAFEGSRRSCKRFGEGNTLASKVYRMIDEEKRVKKLFCFLKSKAIQLLKEELSLEEAEEILIDYLCSFGYVNREKVVVPQEVNIPVKTGSKTTLFGFPLVPVKCKAEIIKSVFIPKQFFKTDSS